VKQLVFRIIDTGIGISKERLKQLFVPFHQGSITVSRKVCESQYRVVVSLACPFCLIDVFSLAVWWHWFGSCDCSLPSINDGWWCECHDRRRRWLHIPVRNEGGYEWMSSEEKMAQRIGKSTRNTTICHNMTVRGGRSGWVHVAHPNMAGCGSLLSSVKTFLVTVRHSLLAHSRCSLFHPCLKNPCAASLLRMISLLMVRCLLSGVVWFVCRFVCVTCALGGSGG
jgi:hypothetical protein